MTDAAPISPLFQASAAGSLRVEGRDGASVGQVYSVLVHKGSGRVTHAVLSLGGFLGMGKSFYPVPFGLLQYDPVRDVYVVTIDKRVLEGGPSWANNAPVFDQAYADRRQNNASSFGEQVPGLLAPNQDFLVSSSVRFIELSSIHFCTRTSQK